MISEEKSQTMKNCLSIDQQNSFFAFNGISKLYRCNPIQCPMNNVDCVFYDFTSIGKVFKDCRPVRNRVGVVGASVDNCISELIGVEIKSFEV